MILFNTGTFKLHSGMISSLKIDCDALTDEDLATLARLIAAKYRFGRIIGIPTGGTRLAEALQPYEDNLYNPYILIVDDVLTTGASMEETREQYPHPFVSGVVIFSRGECPNWITPIFQMWEE
jgi:orotate phosphoribosyltransferase